MLHINLEYRVTELRNNNIDYLNRFCRGLVDMKDLVTFI